MSQIFRAYYAIRRLSSSRGVPTNATFGFITMLRKLLDDHKPTHLGVVFDPEGPTIRHEQFESYKAHRRPTPEDLIAQLPYIRRFCSAMRIPILMQPKYEADDVIGTLTAKAEEIGLHTRIVTIDKDMFQLVSDLTLVLDTRGDYSLLDASRVIEKMGVPPSQVVELLGLRGDASDNIPGAPGIGEKGSVELIKQFGSVEECLNRWEEVRRKAYRESLRDNADLIRRSRDLVTIHRNLPVGLDLDDLKVEPPNLGLLTELFHELEFTSLLKSYSRVGDREIQPAVQVEKVMCARDLDSLWETADKDFRLTFQPVPGVKSPGLAICIGPGKVFLLPADLRPLEFSEAWALLNRHQGPKATYDLKSVYLIVAPHVKKWDLPADDVMLMAYLINPLKTDYSLQALVAEWTDSNQDDAVTTAESTHSLYELLPELSRQLAELSLVELYETIELPLIRVLAEMEMTGIRIDSDQLQELSDELERDLIHLRRRIYELAGIEFNLDSPKQLGEVLFEKMQLPVLKRTRKTKGYSTDQSVLEELAASYEVPRLMLEYRQITKLRSTYIEAIPKLVNSRTNRVHTSYNQTVAATGRLSSSNPNLQNIPIRTELGRKIREAFISEPGHQFVAADYSQIELRVMAHLSEDPVMVEAFLKDQDIHELTANEVFGIMAKASPMEYRRRAKVINFGIIYGLSAFGLSNQLRISRAEAKSFIESYFKRYRGIRSWLDKTLEHARKDGQVRTLFGRLRPIPELRSSNRTVRNFGERIAVNTPIQGTAADLIKLAMIKLYQKLKSGPLRSKIILQVHDELVLECPQEEVQHIRTLLKEVMEGVHSLRVPLRVDVAAASNWKDLK